jgi:polyisoprenyl-teichoic acid--peptidoglycan teichoic acid transferase
VNEPDALPSSSGSGWDWWGLRGLANRRPSRGRSGRRLLAALLSCLIPGAGQLYLGHRRRGAAMLLVTALCVVVAARLLSEPMALSRLLLQPSALIALLVADLGLLVFRLAAVLDAYLLGGVEESPAPAAAAGPASERDATGAPATATGWWHGAAVGLTAIVALTALPHAAVAYYDLQAHDLLTSVFPGDDPLWQANGPDRRQGQGLVTAVPGRMTVLLVGGDAGPGRHGLRTDTMVVASVELASGKVSLFGLPRNLVRVPLPDGPAADYFGECRCFPRLLNELYAFAQDERPDLFPHSRHPGIAALAGAAEELLGLPIDHYALVDLLGFVDVVDALGGVSVDNGRTLRVEIDRLGREGSEPALDLSPGRLHLNGFTALAYSRSRETTSDYDRMERQRCVLGSLARQTDPAELLGVFPRLVKVLKRSVVTDIPTSRLPDLLDAAGGQRVSVSAVGFTPPTYNSGWQTGYPIPDVPKIRAAVRRMTGVSQADTRPSTDETETSGSTSTTRARTPTSTTAPKDTPACAMAG